MSDAQVQKKLDALVRICNELDAEAKRRFGEQGSLFFESGGCFYLMSGDCSGSPPERQKFVKFTSGGHCRLGAGAW